MFIIDHCSTQRSAPAAGRRVSRAGASPRLIGLDDVDHAMEGEPEASAFRLIESG